MKNKILNKGIIKNITIIVFAVAIGIFTITIIASAAQSPKTEASKVQKVSQQILAGGTITAQNQASLNFQIGGKLTYLPFKEGDKVYQGQTIANLDTYALQKQLQLAANTYETVSNNTNQALEGQQSGILEGQQRTSLDATNKNAYSSITQATVISDNVKRIVDNALLAQNSAQINTDLANYALQLGTLTSPIDGIVLHEDVNTSGVNITPITSFVIADPNSMVFSANVRQQDIAFISVGNSASVLLDSSNGQYISGVVDKIYPQKTTLSSGEEVYKVDIKIDNLSATGKLGQGGTVLIKSNFNQAVILVPSWTVLSNNYVWVLSNNKPVLKKITVGDGINGQTEVLKGLSDTDKIIANPGSILSNLYQIL